MDGTQIEIEVLLSLVCVAGLSIPGMVFLHSTRSGIRFRAAAATEPPLWSGWMVLLALVGYQVLIGLFLGFFEAIRLGLAATEFAKGGPGGDPEKPLLLMSTEGLSVAMLAAGGAVTFFILYDVVLRLRQPLATLGVCRAPLVNLLPVILFSLFIIAPILLCALSWALFLQWFGYEPERQLLVEQFSRLLGEGNYPELALMAFNAVVLAPLWEELIFRGLFFGLLKSRWGTLAALVVTSLVFAGYHFSLTAFLPLFCVGMALGYVYSRTRSIYFPILVHAIFNGVNLLLEAFLVPFLRNS
jgi:membrane protease YdiL (CAAX protease family)